MSKTTSRTGAGQAAGLPKDILAAVDAARGKKAVDLVVLDLRSLDSFTDFFVICSGQNVRQVQAIADAVEESLRKLQVRPAHVEGFERAEWVLLDYFDFIVHVFNTERREFYALERLWGSAERVELPGEPGRRR
jgi:ribosome-associated protein